MCEDVNRVSVSAIHLHAGNIAEEPPTSADMRCRGDAGMCSVASTVCSISGLTSALFPGYRSRSGSGPQPRRLQPGALHLLLCVGYHPGEFSF